MAIEIRDAAVSPETRGKAFEQLAYSHLLGLLETADLVLLSPEQTKTLFLHDCGPIERQSIPDGLLIRLTTKKSLRIIATCEYTLEPHGVNKPKQLYKNLDAKPVINLLFSHGETCQEWMLDYLVKSYPQLAEATKLKFNPDEYKAILVILDLPEHEKLKLPQSQRGYKLEIHRVPLSPI